MMRCLTDVSTLLEDFAYTCHWVYRNIFLSCDIPLSLQEDATLLQTKLNNFAPQFTVGTSLELNLHYAT